MKEVWRKLLPFAALVGVAAAPDNSPAAIPSAPGRELVQPSPRFKSTSPQPKERSKAETPDEKNDPGVINEELKVWLGNFDTEWEKANTEAMPIFSRILLEQDLQKRVNLLAEAMTQGSLVDRKNKEAFDLQAEITGEIQRLTAERKVFEDEGGSNRLARIEADEDYRECAQGLTVQIEEFFSKYKGKSVEVAGKEMTAIEAAFFHMAILEMSPHLMNQSKDPGGSLPKERGGR